MRLYASFWEILLHNLPLQQSNIILSEVGGKIIIEIPHWIFRGCRTILAKVNDNQNKSIELTIDWQE